MNSSIKARDKELVQVVPTKRQFDHQRLEFYGFIHFTVNTFTDKEWGDGSEDPMIFNPTKLDVNQWVSAIRSAGMKGVILTCKHHDGFCLWDSRYTEHCVRNSPYKGGKGDIVKELSNACREGGIKFGIYLSPWDRHEKTYGYGESYNDYFVNQLTELLTGYGEIFTVWFDGACGEGSNGKKQSYDWERYYSVIRQLQPNACISVCGEDVRWCGNEAGDTRTSEWSVVPRSLCKSEVVAELSQQSDDKAFRERTFKCVDTDLGSRQALADEQDLIWYPAEIDTSIRPGWFYHEDEDDRVKPLKQLMDIYYKSVGGNGMLLLNVPPTKEGLIHINDERRLKEMGQCIRSAFSNNLADDAVFSANCSDNNVTGSVDNLKTDDYNSYNEGVIDNNPIEITIDLARKRRVSMVVIKENILFSQRVEKFCIYAVVDGVRQLLDSGTTIGYKKISRFNSIKTDSIIVSITDTRVSAVLSFIGVY